MAKEYIDPEQKEFNRFYKWSSRWVKVKPLLKRIGIGVLIIFDIFAISYFVYKFTDFGIFDYFKDQEIVASILDNGDLHNLSEQNAAESLVADDVSVFASTNNQFDFYSEISNPNDDWYATFDYIFSYSGGTTEILSGFILPSESSKPLYALAHDADDAPSNASITLSNVEWYRVNAKQISDYTDWEEGRLDFELVDPTYDRTVELGEETVGRSTVTLVNKTAYGYWEPIFAMVLLRNETPVAINVVTAPEFESNSTREISLNWFDPIPQANTLRVVPIIDIFDPSVYMLLRGSAESDLRDALIID